MDDVRADRYNARVYMFTHSDRPAPATDPDANSRGLYALQALSTHTAFLVGASRCYKTCVRRQHLFSPFPQRAQHYRTTSNFRFEILDREGCPFFRYAFEDRLGPFDLASCRKLYTTATHRTFDGLIFRLDGALRLWLIDVLNGTGLES